MSDLDRTPSERKALRSVAILKLTGRNEGEPGKTLGEAIHAVFADRCEVGSEGDLEETDPVVLAALDGWLNRQPTEQTPPLFRSASPGLPRHFLS